MMQALLLACTSRGSTVAPLTLYDPARHPGARCLDGSPGGFYHRPGAASQWLFVLNGGGLCSHEADCTARAKTDLGSSHAFNRTFDFDSIPLTSSSPANPFRNFNLVFVPYCDGGMHSGQRTSNASADVWGLYFAGHLNVVALVAELRDTAGLGARGDLVLFAGGSAGGVGVFANVEYVAEALPMARVLGVPVGGFPPAVHYFPGCSPCPAEDVRDADFRGWCGCTTASRAWDAARRCPRRRPGGVLCPGWRTRTCECRCSSPRPSRTWW